MSEADRVASAGERTQDAARVWVAALRGAVGEAGIVIPFVVTFVVLAAWSRRPYEEELILEVAVRLEQARGLFPSPPGFGG